jgi:hypothetical protein
MATFRRSHLASPRLGEPAASQRNGTRRWLPVAAVIAALLLALAWFDGGEEPVRPIAEPVDLPERAR